MVEEFDHVWHEGGGNNVGAMILRENGSLFVMTAAGLVNITACAEKGWTVTGEPPKITMTPSLNINNGEWHGYLTDGVLTP